MRMHRGLDPEEGQLQSQEMSRTAITLPSGVLRDKAEIWEVPFIRRVN